MRRWVRNLLENKSIDARNDAREQAAIEVSAPSPLLASKLASARRLGERKLITKADIVFTTETEAGQQLDERERVEWDRRLGGSEGTARGGGGAQAGDRSGW